MGVQTHPASAVRIVLACDQILFRQGLSALLAREPDIDVVGEARTGQAAINVVRATRPDVVLLDLVLSEADGVAAIRVLYHERPHTRVLILSGSREHIRLVAAIRAGAVGFVRTNEPVEALVQSIRAAAQGEVQLSPGAAALLIHEIQEPGAQEHLTRRELEIVQMIADGFMNKEIAWQLRISEKTVKSHVSKILDKFGLQSRTQLAVHALRMGLVLPEGVRSGSLRAGAGTGQTIRKLVAQHRSQDPESRAS